jgi:hypothetical protein
VVESEQCKVENAFCSERSITCQCKPGFELRMKFDDVSDKASSSMIPSTNTIQGTCVELEDSKWTGEWETNTIESSGEELHSLLHTDIEDSEDTDRFLFQTDDDHF